MWSLLQKAVAVNIWRHCGSRQASETCPCCDDGDPESIRHCFFACPGATRAWDFATSVIHHVTGHRKDAHTWNHFSWEQCILGVDLPPPFRPYQHLWSLLRRSTLWIIWIQRNMHVFTAQRWTREALEAALWDVYLDLARIAWLKIQETRKYRPPGLRKALREFQQTWYSSPVFFTNNGNNMRWNFVRPVSGNFG
jgi:hypothetical protein